MCRNCFLDPASHAKHCSAAWVFALSKPGTLHFEGSTFFLHQSDLWLGKWNRSQTMQRVGPLSLESNQRRNQPTLTRLMKYFFKWHASS